MSVTAELERERDCLIRARAELARMRERTLSLKAHGGDPVSSETLAATLYRRAQSLVDDPTANLFFGRIDQQRSDAPARNAGISGDATSPTPTATRSSSTGGPRSRPPSTAPQQQSPWA